jgi:MATE family multidrug resistance protein
MLRLAAPLVLAELGWMAMGIVDTMAVGRVSAEAVGAVGLGTSVFYSFGVCASGLLLGLDTLVAQAFGRKDLDDCRRSLIAGVWLALLLTPGIMLIIGAMPRVLTRAGVQPTVLEQVGPYLRVLNWSAPPLMLYFAFRRYLQAVNIIAPVTFALVSANLVNLAGNWLLVFGNLGAPRMGAEGAAWATLVSRIYQAAILGAAVWRHTPGLRARSWRADFGRMRDLLRLGIPAAGQIGVEVAVFALVTVLVGKLNALSLAGHQIALTVVSTTFMMPLGISSAAAVRVGQALGRGDRSGAAHAGWTALALGASVMCGAALALLFVPDWIARLFTPDAAIAGAAVVLLRVAAFFQLFDGLQVVATGALRGASDTRTPALCHFAGYWIIGLPLGVWLCFSRGFGAAGLWSGLSAGLILIGCVLALFWLRTVRRWPSASGRPPNDRMVE